MKIKEAVVFESEQMLIENAITDAIKKLIPNALIPMKLEIYSDGRNEAIAHAIKGSSHEYVHAIGSKVVTKSGKISKKEAEEYIDSAVASGFKLVKKSRPFMKILIGLPVFGGLIYMAKGVLEALAKRNANPISFKIPGTSPSSPPLGVSMGPDPDFPAMYKQNLPTQTIKGMQNELSPEAWKRLNDEAIDRTVGYDGIFQFEKFMSHLRRLVLDELGHADVLPGYLP